jgi:hypothetical protein
VEVELVSEIARLERALAHSEDTTTRKDLQRALTDRQTQLAVMLEQRSRSRRT